MVLKVFLNNKTLESQGDLSLDATNVLLSPHGYMPYNVFTTLLCIKAAYVHVLVWACNKKKME